MNMLRIARRAELRKEPGEFAHIHPAAYAARLAMAGEKPMRRQGMMLLDLLVSIILIAVLCGVFALILNHTLQVQRLQAQSFDRLQQSKAVADLFRADVARAIAAPQQWGKYVAEPQTLILQMDGDEHVVYQWRDSSLKRFAPKKGDAGERIVPTPFAMAVEFVQPEGGAKLVRLRLTPIRRDKELTGQSIELAANVGGDRR